MLRAGQSGNRKFEEKAKNNNNKLHWIYLTASTRSIELNENYFKPSSFQPKLGELGGLRKCKSENHTNIVSPPVEIWYVTILSITELQVTSRKKFFFLSTDL